MDYEDQARQAAKVGLKARKSRRHRGSINNLEVAVEKVFASAGKTT